MYHFLKASLGKDERQENRAYIDAAAKGSQQTAACNPKAERQATVKEINKVSRAYLGDKHGTKPAAPAKGIKQFFTPKAAAGTPEAQEEAKMAIAELIYESGLAFNLARREVYHEAMAKVANAGPGFKPPTAEALRTTFLQKVRSG